MNTNNLESNDKKDLTTSIAYMLVGYWKQGIPSRDTLLLSWIMFSLTFVFTTPNVFWRLRPKISFQQPYSSLHYNWAKKIQSPGTRGCPPVPPFPVARWMTILEHVIFFSSIITRPKKITEPRCTGLSPLFLIFQSLAWMTILEHVVFFSSIGHDYPLLNSLGTSDRS